MNINRVIYIETDLNRFDYIDSCLKLKGEHFAFYDSAPNVILNDVVYNFVVRSGIIIIAKSASVVCTEIHLYYIEYWGYDDNNRDYTKTKKFKMPLYKKQGITLINVNAKSDLRNLKMNLRHKLQNYKIGISNFEDE